MTASSTPAQRLAQLVAHIRQGWSIVQACRVLRVSQRTVWRWRRTKPEFAAALHEALALGADIRKSWHDDDIREAYSAHALEMSDHHSREDAPAKRDYTGKPTRRQRRLLAKLHGVNTALFPGRSPSHSQESDDVIERMGQRMTRAQMQTSFEERRKLKRGGLAGNTPSITEATHMKSADKQQLFRLLAQGSTVPSAARKLGLDPDDILAERQADPEFTRALPEAIEQAAEAREASKAEKPKKSGRAGVLW